MRSCRGIGILRRLIEFLNTGTAGDESTQRRNAIASYAAMIGAMILARVSDNDPELSDEIIEQTRAWIVERAAAPAVGK